MFKSIILPAQFFVLSFISFGQSVTETMLRLPDTGEKTSYTNTFGEDADYTFFPPYFTINGDGTVTDTVTGLMWQKTDGGEMTIESAIFYCDNLTLGGYYDWRLPDAHESFSILNHQFSNPATDSTVFTITDAEYWWTSVRQADDSNKVWVTNWGGGIGNHSKFETISAGGTRKIHVRAVRQMNTPAVVPGHFTDNGDGTVTDNLTKLVWQKYPNSDTLTWEQSLAFAEALTLAGKSDWRLPNIKELQSINDETRINPSVDTTYFSTIGVKKYWSSTSLPNQTTQAWYLQTHFGITTHDLKTRKNNLICVRGNPGVLTSVQENPDSHQINIFPNPAMKSVSILIPGRSEIEILNLQGQLLKRISSDATCVSVDISEFIKGIYFVRIIHEKDIFTKKLIKE